MRITTGAILLTLLAQTTARSAVTPVEKVITLLEDLLTEIESDGGEAASTYDKFACFCKDTTSEKSDSITAGNDKIDSLSADIAEDTASKEEKATELQKRKQKQEDLAAELEEETARCKKEAFEYEVTAADMSKAISSLASAKEALSASKPAAFLALRQSVEESLAFADAMNMIPAPSHRVLSSFMQQGVDPDDSDYKFHSSSIVELLEKLHTEFQDKKKDLDEEWEKTKKACDDLKASLSKQMSENKSCMETLETEIPELAKTIADNREELENTEIALKDDQLYMKDLTQRCEEKANLWDQRTQMRAGEIEALKKALEILTNKVQSADEETGRGRAKFVPTKLEKNLLQGGARVEKLVSFLQETAEVAYSQRLETHDFKGKKEAIEMLTAKARHINSELLFSVSRRVAEDPFTKVKQIIQQLIERLIKEATNEATKKGFCDTELGKAKKDRDFRLGDVRRLNADIAGLEAKKEELEQEITELTEALESLRASLKEATHLRGEEKEENLKIIKRSKEGLAAVTEAIAVLQDFYKQAAKAKEFLQASPIDEDNPGAGFKGEYAGKQTASKGIIGLLEVIQSDFERTGRKTAAEEKKAAADFVEFERTAKADIAGKETKKELDEQDLETTKNSITTKMEDLKNAVDLLDDALKAEEALVPMCVDTGMSYKERVEKREEEIAALESALTILAPTDA